MKIAFIHGRETMAEGYKHVFDEHGIQYGDFVLDDTCTIPAEYDLYLRLDHGDYAYDIAHTLHPAVFYVVDTHLKKPYRLIKQQVRHYDIAFCAQKDGVEKLRKDTGVDVQWLPLGFDATICKTLDLPKQYDIGFVGRDAMKYDRGRRLALLRKKYPQSYIDRAEFKTIAKIYSAAKIGFNCSVSNDINLRMFEIMGCGCFLLTNRLKNVGLDDLFQDGEHLVTYKNDKEMLELIDYYLQHDSERERIAQAGYQRVTERHTFYHHLQNMFNYLAFKWGGKFNALRVQPLPG